MNETNQMRKQIGSNNKSIQNKQQSDYNYRISNQQPTIMRTPTNTFHTQFGPAQSTAHCGNALLGNKDLIIRMLAEVFQVNQLDDGQVRWQQVSTSLVPVSLYSRTTSKWLNYLLAASSMATNNAATSTMSPDSRDFLLYLLHQFHQQNGQQQRQQLTSSLVHQASSFNHYNQAATIQSLIDGQDYIVFQVVGHDFLSGKCKRILNVKIAQPGTRLGQASDYFVYWKEPAYPPYFTSLTSSGQQQRSNNYNPQRQWLQQQTSTSCLIEPQTWGLNFASTNDARLFYDICSLNLVDIDLESDYLRHLANANASWMWPPGIRSQKALGQQRRHQQPCNLCSQTMDKTPTTRAHGQRQAGMRPFHRRLLNDVSVDSRNCPVHMSEQTRGRRVLSTRTRSRSTTRQPSTQTTGEPEGGGVQRMKRVRSLSTPASPISLGATGCPVHQESTLQADDEQDDGLTITQFNHGDHYDSYHPRCTSLARKRGELLAKQSTDSETNVQADPRPQKPARGFLRDSMHEQYNLGKVKRQHLTISASHQSQCHPLPPPPVPAHQTQPRRQISSHQDTMTAMSVSADGPTGAVLTTYNCETELARPDQVTQHGSGDDDNKNNLQGANVDDGTKTSVSRPETMAMDRQVAKHFAASRASQRRSTGLEMSSRPISSGGHHLNLHQQQKLRVTRQQQHELKFDRNGRMEQCPCDDCDAAGYGADSNEDELVSRLNTLSHKDARLARARYANSKNMKEFLSLDASAQAQTTPTQLVELNERFQQQAQVLKAARAAAAEALTMEPQPAEGVQGEEEDFVRNVATTTDDLPLDSATRQRMFKLTSEDVKSGSEPTGNGSGNAVHSRALSLGRELRGRSARSDIGRRRSLERSGCVDLDQASLIVTPERGKRHRKQLHPMGRLSPVMQSMQASPAPRPPPDSFKSSPSYEQHNYHLPPRRRRVVSSGSTSQPSRMISFKSAPDFSELCTDSGQHARHHFNERKQLASRRVHQTNRLPAPDPQAMTTATRPKQLSSYAIPLCSEEVSGEMYQLERQYHSCPSSLRRKNHTSARSHQLLDQSDLHPLTGHCGANTCPNLTSTANSQQNWPCQCCNTGQQQQQRSWRAYHLPASHQTRGDFCVCPLCQREARAQGQAPSLPPPWQAATSQHCDCTKRLISCCHVQKQHFTGGAHQHCAPGMLQSSGGQEFGANRLQARPCSSLSSRSPLHYGLYESEVEDLIVPAPEPSYQPQPQHALCYGGQPSPSLVHFQAGSSTSASSFRPVQGYDQTLARASTLKSRQRAKSQPPIGMEPGDDGGNNDCQSRQTGVQAQFYRGKSMENVQKLIREVQCELNALARRPMAGLQCLGATFVSSSGPERAAIVKARQPETKLASSRVFKDASLAPESTERTMTLGAAARVSNSGQVSQLQSYYRVNIPSTMHIQQKNCMASPKRGLKCYAHQHDARDTKSVELCELSFLKKMQMSQEGGGKWREHHIGIEPGAAQQTSATRLAGQFKCVGAIRKAGFLSVKKWILKRRRSIELARKQGWKQYWVCLRGTALLFHTVIEEEEVAAANGNTSTNKRIDLLSWLNANCAGQLDAVAQSLKNELQQSAANNNQKVATREDFFCRMSKCYIEHEPRHLIIIESAIAQPIPEHPRRDFVFCLSTSFGDAYLFQAACQLESDNWIAAIHNACAASIARDLTRDEAVKLFESRVINLELEAEKKIFLRQRLESRLTSMSSIGATAAAGSGPSLEAASTGEKITMRSLLHKLSQQLLALDAYIEQMHCEIYQLRCYLSSCGAQQVFYQRAQSADANGRPPTGIAATKSTNTLHFAQDLPHPKSLLMHVSKATKLLLIKLGVFTVSSFHAYTHARQESADCILQNIQQVTSGSKQPASSNLLTNASDKHSVELRVRSHSLNESLMTRIEARSSNLESDAERLIELSDLRPVSISVAKKLYKQIRADLGAAMEGRKSNEDTTSDDRYSIHEQADQVVVNMKLHSNSDQASIIRQLLRAIEASCSEFQFLNYYLVFKLPNPSAQGDSGRGCEAQKQEYVAKRRESLKDWNGFGGHLELMEKVIFRVELIRHKMDEESAPFGVSVDAQLIQSNEEASLESQLNVFCSYIEWGSVADKAGLRDDDELLMINGVPVKDLDMMFVECLIQESTRLRVIVRSSRADCPPGASQLDTVTWRPTGGSSGGSDEDDDDSNGNSAGGGGDSNSGQANGAKGVANKKQMHLADDNVNQQAAPTQLISDEYISSLVCPPPPSQTDAFLRPDTSLLRQKSDLSGFQVRGHEDEDRRKALDMARARSQHGLDLATAENLDDPEQILLLSPSTLEDDESERATLKGDLLADQQLKKGEQLTATLFHGHEQDERKQAPTSSADANSIERLRKSVLELLETEYAFIKHLETISEHYLHPLAEISFLNIQQLKVLNRVLHDLLRFQRSFFSQLLRSVLRACHLIGPTSDESNQEHDELEDLNLIVQHLDSHKSLAAFIPTLNAIAATFENEANRFKQYVSYCVAYSKLQKLLHPRQNGAGNLGNSASSSSIVFTPSSLKTLHTSNSQSFLTGATSAGASSSGQQRSDFLKPLGALIQSNKSTTNDQQEAQQLRSLAEFLANLDSSSSSVSLSLPKSSSSETTNNELASKKPGNATATTTTIFSHKSAHQQNFESYLIKPIQRIVKYPMLLNSISVSASQLISDDGTTGGQDTQADLQNAVSKMESVVSHVNDAQCLHDEYGNHFETIERLYVEQQAETLGRQASPLVGAHQPPIDLSVEQLLYYNSVEWLNSGEFVPKLKKVSQANLSQILFVFNSCVVFICKERVKSNVKRRGLQSMSAAGSPLNRITSMAAPTSGKQPTNKTFAIRELGNSPMCSSVIRYQCLIPVSEVQVRSVPTPVGEATSSKSTPLYKWEMFQCSSSNSNSNLLTKSNKRTTNSKSGKVFLLASRSNEERNLFLRKIRLIIRDSVRNMSLRLTRSPSSKSLTNEEKDNKKLSSPSSGTNTNNSSCSHSTSLSPAFNSGDTNFVVDCNQIVRDPTNVSPGASFKAGIQVNN